MHKYYKLEKEQRFVGGIMKVKFSSKKSNKIVTVVVALIIVFYMLASQKFFGQRRYELYTLKNEKSTNTADVFEKTESEEIFVHITGAVQNSGVVKMKKGSRLFEAIEEAGGFTESANQDAVNLAQILVDGYKYYIPTENETYYEENTKKVNINTATKEELMKIDGIGEKMAERIIKYREKNGPFKRIEELQEVSGIGASKFEMIKDYVVC